MNTKFKVAPAYDKDIFITRFQKLMDSYGLNGIRVAEKIQISASCISRYLSGISSPDILALWKIADTFNVSIDWLIGRDSYDSLPAEIADLLNKYTLASSEDKVVIQTILHKYE